MTNNRKPVDEIRLSLSAAREDDSQPLHIATEGSLNQLPAKHRKGWTPAPTKPMYSQTNVTLEHKGRDIESLMRYHEAHKKPVGYWEDAPRGMKFGGSGASAVGAQVARSATGGDAVQLGVPATPNRAAPTTTPPADGPWPKWVKWPSACLTRFDSNTSGKTWYTSGGCYPFSAGDYASSGERDGMDLTRSEALQWLEQNGHKDAAAQLRGKAICPQKPEQ